MGISQNIFFEEAKDTILEMEAVILEIEKLNNASGISVNSELINRYFRALHTLKGLGSISGVLEAVPFIHDMETILDLVKQNRFIISEKFIDLNFVAVDVIRHLFINKSPCPKEKNGVSAALKKIISDHESKKVITEKKVVFTYRLKISMHPENFNPALNPAFLFEELKKLGKFELYIKPDIIPKKDEVKPDSPYLYWESALETTDDINTIKKMFMSIINDADINIEIVARDYTNKAI